MATDTPHTSELARLLSIIARLRAPDGCPWDREQSTTSMAPHLLEEAYEAVEALNRGDREASCEELGDLLMNILMVAQISSEAGGYDQADIASRIADKLIRRHPHVFGEVEANDSATVLANWEAIKLQESSGKDQPRTVLGGVPTDLPALLRAFRVGEKAARVGFDWPDCKGPRQKVDEELAELDQAIAAGDTEQIADELGDVLFSVVNLARHTGANPEMALRRTIDRFTARFDLVERNLGDRLSQAKLDELEAAWQAAKRQLES